MSRPHATETGRGQITTGLTDSSAAKKRISVPLDRLLYLQALFPYASFHQLQSIITDTTSADEAANLGYEALNPDYTGLPYLKQQWQLKGDRHASYAERKSAFHGVTETLADRAADLFSLGQLANVSSVREFDSTMQLFPIDTSDWDEVYLHNAKTPGEYANEVLPLTAAELQSPFTRAQSMHLRQASSAMERGQSYSGMDYSLGASGLETDTQAPLSAPIVRWGPRAMRVSTHQAREAQHQVFRIFDDAAFFSTPLVPFDFSDAPGQATPSESSARSVSNSAHEPLDDPASGEPRMTARSAVSHEPLDEPVAPGEPLPAFTSPPSGGENDDAGFDSIVSVGVVGPRSRASALLALEDQKARGRAAESRQLQSRMQKLRPLDNTVFQQPDAATPEHGPASSPQGARAVPNAAAVNHGVPTVGYDTEPNVKAMSTSAYLEREVAQWDQTISTLKPYDGVFDFKNRCELVRELHDNCPLLVKRVELVATRLLSVLSLELVGKRVSEGLREVPVEIPLCGCKLVSTGEIRVRALTLDSEKCVAQFQDEGSRLRIKVHVKEFALDPVSFAYIDETTAAKERRKNAQERPAQTAQQRRTGEITSGESSNFVTGVTKGTMTLACKKASVDLVGGAWLLSSGKVFVIIEEANVKLGSLSVSSDVTKLNVLTTLAKPVLKSVLKKQLKGALEGSHPL